MNALAAIHVAKKQLGLDEEAYRALLERVTGKRSAGRMDWREQKAVIEELRRLGFRPASKAPAKGLQGPFGPKLQALWISGWHLGVVRDRNDRALTAFVERQTGISHTRFLRDAGAAAKAIEALKSWLAREGGVDWSVDASRPPVMNDPKFQVVMAQWRKLIALGAVFVSSRSDLRSSSPLDFGNDESRTLTATIALETGKGSLDELTDEDWSTLMAALGRRIRVARRVPGSAQGAARGQAPAA